jgi:hypothetical protein
MLSPQPPLLAEQLLKLTGAQSERTTAELARRRK